MGLYQSIASCQAEEKPSHDGAMASLKQKAVCLTPNAVHLTDRNVDRAVFLAARGQLFSRANGLLDFRGGKGISQQESGAANAGRQVSVWRCATAGVVRLDYRTLADLQGSIARVR